MPRDKPQYQIMSTSTPINLDTLDPEPNDPTDPDWSPNGNGKRKAPAAGSRRSVARATASTAPTSPHDVLESFMNPSFWAPGIMKAWRVQKGQTADLRKSNAQMRHQISLAELQVASVKRECEVAKALVETTKVALDTAKAETAEAERKLNSATRALDTAKAETREAERKLNTANMLNDNNVAEIASLRLRLERTLPTQCSACDEDIATIWCTKSPGPDKPAHGFCVDCITTAVEPYTTFNASGCHWLDSRSGLSCPYGCGHVFNIDDIAAIGCSKDSIDKYKECQGRARQHVETSEMARQAYESNNHATLQSVLDAAMSKAAREAVSCPSCHMMGLPEAGQCMAIECVCGVEYCGFCFEFAVPIDPSDTTCHDHVAGCPSNYNPAGANGEKSYYVRDRQAYKDFFEARSKQAAEKEKQRIIGSMRVESAPFFTE
jgi:hypothetical protein